MCKSIYITQLSKSPVQNDYTEKSNLELENARDLKVEKHKIVCNLEACVLRKGRGLLSKERLPR